MNNDPLSRGLRTVLLILSVVAVAGICFICICKISDELKSEPDPVPTSIISAVYGDNEPTANFGFPETVPAEETPEEESLTEQPAENTDLSAEEDQSLTVSAAPDETSD